MSIHVPSPRYGSSSRVTTRPDGAVVPRAGPPDGPAPPKTSILAGAARSVDAPSPGPADPTASDEVEVEGVDAHAAAPNTSRSASARADHDPIDPSPLWRPETPVPRDRERSNPSEGSVLEPDPLNRGGCVSRDPGGFGRRRHR